MVEPHAHVSHQAKSGQGSRCEPVANSVVSTLIVFTQSSIFYIFGILLEYNINIINLPTSTFICLMVGPHAHASRQAKTRQGSRCKFECPHLTVFNQSSSQCYIIESVYYIILINVNVTLNTPSLDKNTYFSVTRYLSKTRPLTLDRM